MSCHVIYIYSDIRTSKYSPFSWRIFSGTSSHAGFISSKLSRYKMLVILFELIAGANGCMSIWNIFNSTLFCWLAGLVQLTVDRISSCCCCWLWPSHSIHAWSKCREPATLRYKPHEQGALTYAVSTCRKLILQYVLKILTDKLMNLTNADWHPSLGRSLLPSLTWLCCCEPEIIVRGCNFNSVLRTFKYMTDLYTSSHCLHIYLPYFSSSCLLINFSVFINTIFLTANTPVKLSVFWSQQLSAYINYRALSTHFTASSIHAWL